MPGWTVAEADGEGVGEEGGARACAGSGREGRRRALPLAALPGRHLEDALSAKVPGGQPDQRAREGHDNEDGRGGPHPHHQARRPPPPRPPARPGPQRPREPPQPRAGRPHRPPPAQPPLHPRALAGPRGPL